MSASSIMFRPATRDDAAFVGWVMLTAMRSHLKQGVLDYAIDGSDETRLDFARRLALADLPSAAAFGSFEVAEVDGVPAAAVSSFPGHAGYGAMATANAKVMDELNWSEEARANYARVFGTMITCFEMPAEDFWALEFVATQPKYRGRGLMLALLKRAMERGAAAGFKEARISYFIGNQPAEQTYIRAGLKPAGERRSWDFEAAFGPPGVRYATRRLDG